MTISEFLKEPMQGKTSLSRVVWLYSILGSLLFGAIELFLDPENQFVMRTYTFLGFFYGIYISAAVYLCAKNCKSPTVARAARVCAVISLVLVPALTYLELQGALSLTSLMERMPE
jgi:hypothetical protein